MFTVSTDALHTPLVIAQVKAYTPGIIPVTVEEGLDGVVIAGEFGPLSKDHEPMPIAGELPAKAVEVTLHRF